MKINARNIFNLLLFAATLFFVVDALQFTPKARLLPLIVGVPAVILCTFQLWTDLTKESEYRSEDEKKRERVIFTWLGIFVLLLVFLGMTIGIVSFLMGFTRLVARRGWGSCALVTSLGFLLVYGIFGQLMHFTLYRGLLFPLIY